MSIKLTFRWYGKSDVILLKHIKQIPAMTGVVTAICDIPVGKVWPLDTLQKLKEECNNAGLQMEVIESVPVHEDIKMGLESRDSNEQAQKLDIKNFWLPGWDDTYKGEERLKVIERYKKMGRETLFNNLVYFLNKVIPVCEQLDIKMAIHPDDPPWEVFDIPRIISCENDLDNLFKVVPSKYNTSAFCTGSFGANPSNDIVKMASKFAKANRIGFAHLRNVKHLDENSFCESAHLSSAGSLDMYKIAKALIDGGFDSYIRPDHGRNIFDEKERPGYGLYDRALGASYITVLIEAIKKGKK